jgi:hypothetical protein
MKLEGLVGAVITTSLTWQPLKSLHSKRYIKLKQLTI